MGMHPINIGCGQAKEVVRNEIDNLVASHDLKYLRFNYHKQYASSIFLATEQSPIEGENQIPVSY